MEREVYINKKVNNASRSMVKSTYEDQALKKEESRLNNLISESKLDISKIRAEIELLKKKELNLTLRSDIDYTTQNAKLRHFIEEMK